MRSAYGREVVPAYQELDDAGVVADRGADAVGAGGAQALLKQAVRQQVRRDDYATVAGSAQVGDHVADLRFTRRDVADPYGRTGEFREHGRASAHVVAGARVGGPGRREDHRVARAPAGLDESGVPDAASAGSGPSGRVTATDRCPLAATSRGTSVCT